jgi:hypothetical protein
MKANVNHLEFQSSAEGACTFGQRSFGQHSYNNMSWMICHLAKPVMFPSVCQISNVTISWDVS